jgi:hypothetical protein
LHQAIEHTSHYFQGFDFRNDVQPGMTIKYHQPLKLYVYHWVTSGDRRERRILSAQHVHGLYCHWLLRYSPQPTHNRETVQHCQPGRACDTGWPSPAHFFAERLVFVLHTNQASTVAGRLPAPQLWTSHRISEKHPMRRTIVGIFRL